MRYLTLFIILILFWLLLTFELSPANLVTGAVAALIATLFFGKYFVRDVKKFFQPARYFWLLVYLFIFIWECLKANFDVAYRVLHPAMPIRPGIVKVRLNLESDIGRTFRAMSITMTPGTIAVDIIDDYIYIHWIFISSTEPEVYSKKISGRFEKHLKRIFE